MAASIGWSIPEPKIHSNPSESPRYREILKKGVLTFRSQPLLRLLAVDSVLVAASAYFVIWFYQPLLTKTGVSVFYFGFIHALLLGTEIFISSHFGWIERIFGQGGRYLKLSAVITSLGFFLVAFYPSLITILIFVLGAGGIGLTRANYIEAIANKQIQSQERATILSSISMLRRLALIVLNPLVGMTADYSLPFALILVGLLPLGTLLIRGEKKAVR